MERQSFEMEKIKAGKWQLSGGSVRQSRQLALQTAAGLGLVRDGKLSGGRPLESPDVVSCLNLLPNFIERDPDVVFLFVVADCTGNGLVRL